jgi:hypothetical protein
MVGRFVISAATTEGMLKRMEGDIARSDYLIGECGMKLLSQKGQLVIVPQNVIREGLHAVSIFRLDFGALDLVSDDHGMAFVVDVNTTPYWAEPSRNRIVEHLRGWKC